MSDISTETFASSTNLALINEWPSMRSIIAKSASTVATKQQMDVESFDSLMHLITAVQFSDATTGPLHPFINKLLWGYAQLSKIKLKLVITQDDNLKPHILDKEVELPTSVNIKETNTASIDKLIRQLDELALTQHTQWQELIESWGQQLVMQLTMNGVNLSELEISNLSQSETRSEIEAQFTDLKIELPKLKNDLLSFADYFKLKVILALHSSLSRQHLPHEMAEIQKTLKKFKADFKQINQQERELINQQHHEISELIPQ